MLSQVHLHINMNAYNREGKRDHFIWFSYRLEKDSQSSMPYKLYVS